MQVGISDGSHSTALCHGEHIEQWLQSGLDVQNQFIPWDNGRYEFDELFGRTIPSFWEAGRVPMLTWELFLTTGSTPDDILSRVTDGEYDEYISAWVSRLNRAAQESETETPSIYLRLAHEMNGNWYPWAPAGGSGTPEKYIKMWQHVHDRVEAQCLDEIQIKWVWAVNGTDVGEYAMEELYPGDEYVDWVAFDCYNWGTSQSWSSWRSPSETFTEPVRRLKSLSNNPVALTEVGCSSLLSTGHDPSRKAEWISDAFAVLDELGVDMCIWFNEDKESDWAIFGGERGEKTVTIDGKEYEAYSAFAEAVDTY